jgi:hypothetical protein
MDVGMTRCPALHMSPDRFDLEHLELANRFAHTDKLLVFHSERYFHRAPLCAGKFLRVLSREHPDATCQVRVVQGGYRSWLMTRDSLKVST